MEVVLVTTSTKLNTSIRDRDHVVGGRIGITGMMTKRETVHVDCKVLTLRTPLLFQRQRQYNSTKRRRKTKFTVVTFKKDHKKSYKLCEIVSEERPQQPSSTTSPSKPHFHNPTIQTTQCPNSRPSRSSLCTSTQPPRASLPHQTPSPFNPSSPPSTHCTNNSSPSTPRPAPHQHQSP